MRILIAGGGTGGHIFPAIALAEAFNKISRESRILFVGTRNRLEVSTLSKRGFPHMSIAVTGLKGRSLWRQVQSLLCIPKGFFQAMEIIRRFNPDIVVGVGGYASGPVVLAAKLLRRNVVIHEQNLIPGFTNRLLGRIADRIFISLPDKFHMFKKSRTVLTGNPIRQDILSVRKDRPSGEQFRLLIVGGSQGAHAINRAMIEALDHLSNLEEIAFVHQTGADDLDWVESAYVRHGISAEVRPFFEEMAAAYRESDLIVCRAGATTVAELTALGKPAIYIPFPFAVHNHQELNARYVTDASGGELLLETDLTGKALAEKIERYVSNPAALERMSARARKLGKPEAADAVVNECKRLLVMNRSWNIETEVSAKR